MDEILLRAVKRVLASNKENKLVLLEEMLGLDWREQVEAEGIVLEAGIGESQ